MEVRNPDSLVLSTESILSKIDEIGNELALVLFPAVQYYTGQVFDMKAIVEKTHSNGAICGLGWFRRENN